MERSRGWASMALRYSLHCAFHLATGIAHRCQPVFVTEHVNAVKFQTHFLLDVGNCNLSQRVREMSWNFKMPGEWSHDVT